MKAYLCLVTWADGTEGLLFPRPGNVPIAKTAEQGQADFETAKEHLLEYFEQVALMDIAKKPVTIRLVEYNRGPANSNGVCMPNFGPHSVTITESQRQAILLAIAHLAVERPGWNMMLTEIAMLMDTPESWKRRQQEALKSPGPHPIVPKGQPVMFNRFKVYHQAALQQANVQALAEEASAKWIGYHEHMCGNGVTESNFQEGYAKFINS